MKRYVGTAPSAHTAAAAAILAGLMMAMAMPPWPLGFLAPLGMALWLWALQGELPPFRSGLLFGAAFAAPALFWIGWVTVPGTVALVFITAAEYGLLAATYRRVQTRKGRGAALVAFAAMWPVLELMRAAGFIGFPWLNLAHTQLDYLWLYQFVEYTGDYGLSLWVVGCGVLIYTAATHRSARAALAVLLWVALPTIWGAWRMGHLPPVERRVKVGIVQGDIDTYRKWDVGYVDTSFAVYDSLSRIVADSVELIIWPETAAPTYLMQVPSRRAWATELVEELQTPILLGSLSYRRTPQGDQIYNSAFELFPDGRWEGPYSKQQLVPFGEMIPGARWFPALARIDLGQGNFAPGPGPVVFDRARYPHSVLICYESAFSRLCRQQVLRGARFLVIITNDSWYGRTPGPAQHAAMASLRAAEFRVGVARAANGGISLWVDRTGRRRGATRLFTRTVTTGTIPLGAGPTFYARHGLWILWIVGPVAAFFALMAWWPGRRL